MLQELYQQIALALVLEEITKYRLSQDHIAEDSPSSVQEEVAELQRWLGKVLVPPSLSIKI